MVRWFSYFVGGFMLYLFVFISIYYFPIRW